MSLCRAIFTTTCTVGDTRTGDFVGSLSNSPCRVVVLGDAGRTAISLCTLALARVSCRLAFCWRGFTPHKALCIVAEYAVATYFDRLSIVYWNIVSQRSNRKPSMSGFGNFSIRHKHPAVEICIVSF